MKPSAWIAVAAWTLFVLSFFLPAAQLGLADEQLARGWQAAIAAAYGVLMIREAPFLGLLSIASDAANVCMLVSPLTIFRRRTGAQTLRASIVMIAASGVAALWVLSSSAKALTERTTLDRYGAGYYLWVASFGVMAAALFARARERRD